MPCRGYWQNFKHKLQKGKTGHFTKRIWELQSIDQRHETADWNACTAEDNGTTVDKLLSPVSQEDQKQTYLSTHLIAKKKVLIYCSIIYCHLSLKCLICLPMQLLPIASFSNIYILHGSVVTQLWWSGTFNSSFIVNCPQNVPMKKFWKSINISWR